MTLCAKRKSRIEEGASATLAVRDWGAYLLTHREVQEGLLRSPRNRAAGTVQSPRVLWRAFQTVARSAKAQRQETASVFIRREPSL